MKHFRIKSNYRYPLSIKVFKLLETIYRSSFLGFVAGTMARPTGHKLAPTTLQAVLDRINTGVNDTQIYRRTGVTPICTRKLRLNLSQWGQPYAPATVKVGRPSTLRDIHRRLLREYPEGRPQAYLEEIENGC